MTIVLRWKVVARLVRQHGWTRGAELGVWKGQTLFHLLDTCPDLTMIGVDNWRTSDTPHQKDMQAGRSTWHPPDVIRGYRDKVVEKSKNYEGRLVLYEMDTVEAAALVEDASLDFAFVDANHAEPGVLRDIAAWKPKIRAGGSIVGHDRNWPSVQRALKQSFPQGWKEHQDNIWECPM